MRAGDGVKLRRSCAHCCLAAVPRRAMPLASASRSPPAWRERSSAVWRRTSRAPPWSDTKSCAPAATRRMRRRPSISPWRSPSRPRPALAAAASAWSKTSRRKPPGPCTSSPWLRERCRRRRPGPAPFPATCADFPPCTPSTGACAGRRWWRRPRTWPVSASRSPAPSPAIWRRWKRPCSWSPKPGAYSAARTDGGWSGKGTS